MKKREEGGGRQKSGRKVRRGGHKAGGVEGKVICGWRGKEDEWMGEGGGELRYGEGWQGKKGGGTDGKKKRWMWGWDDVL